MAMTKVPFNGNLNSNEIVSAIYNMIISQQIFADNIKKGFGLADMFRTDGTLYGDTKLFYSTDVLKTHAWTNDSEAANLLSLDRGTAPKCQAITIDTFKQIRLTLDNYLSKRAWATEGSFGQFYSVMMGWISKTKEVYDNTLINAFCGTVETPNSQNASLVNSKKIILAASPATVDAYALRGLKIGEGIADLLVDLQDYSRVYNGYKFLRNYDPNDFVMIWNSNYRNEIRNVDLPTVFHKDGVVAKLEGKYLPEKYFGIVITNTNKDTYADNTPTTGKPLDKDGGYVYTPGTANANGCIRSLVECDVTVSGTAYHLLPGDEIPSGTALATSTGAGKLLFGEVYINDAKIIGKLVHKDAIKFMSGFQVETEFFNPRSLTSNHYLTYGYGLDHLWEFPIIKIYEAAS